jgi:hypothetical protein
MVTITKFEEQYLFAKMSSIKAIHSGENIVLWGSGANGKSYLIRDLKKIISDNDYQPIPGPSCGDNSDYVMNMLENSDKSKWIMAINDIQHIQSTLKKHSFVFVNMDEYVYPAYATLRSGRKINI